MKSACKVPTVSEQNVHLYAIFTFWGVWQSKIRAEWVRSVSDWGHLISEWIADLVQKFQRAAVPRSWRRNWTHFLKTWILHCLFNSLHVREEKWIEKFGGSREEWNFRWFRVLKMHLFARNAHTRSKFDETNMGSTQIDPRGHDGTRISGICSYYAG